MTFKAIFIQAGEGSSSLMSMLPFIAMIVVLYFFMIRPQRNKQKKEQKFQAEIKKGTRIVTTSGIHGKVADLNDTEGTVTIETGAGKIKFERAAISMEMSKKYLKTDK